jgi:predicted metal-dependent hydrolase
LSKKLYHGNYRRQGWLRLSLCFIRNLFGILPPMLIPIDHLVRSRRRTVALIIQPDGTLTVRAPLHTPEAVIRHFVQDHSSWIIKKQALVRSAPPPLVKAFVAGEKFLYLGQEFPLTIVGTQRSPLTLDAAGFHLAGSHLPDARQVFSHWYRVQAARRISERVVFYAQEHKFSYRKVRISSARTRWGSCSTAGTLSFTWRLVLAPLQVIDYVVLHELLHTRIKNHSPDFWLKLAEIMPDYKRHLAWLKKNGRFLTLGYD